MTRELSPKAQAELIKKAFAAKGVKLPHTQALDLVARTKGFEAWSHMQQATRKSETVAARKAVSLADVLCEHYGAWSECPAYPLEDWQYEAANKDTYRGYWSWVAAQVEADRADCSLEFEPGAPVDVRLPGGKQARWHIEHYLSGRDGELNHFAEHTKPGLAVLSLDAALLESLRELMWDEATFIVRKDGRFGILFEAEYCSRESEAEFLEDAPEELAQCKSHDEVVTSLLAALARLQPQYGLEMCVPDSSVIVHDRPAVWAFMPMDKPLSPEEREALGIALLSL